MVKILLLFLFIYLIYIIVKPIVKLWRTMYKMRQGDFSGLGDLFGQPGAQKSNSAYDADGQRKGGWSKAHTRKKKIGRDVGEYVKFSEVTVTEETSQTDSSGNTTYPTEQQVTDVEWEDINIQQ